MNKPTKTFISARDLCHRSRWGNEQLSTWTNASKDTVTVELYIGDVGPRTEMVVNEDGEETRRAVSSPPIYMREVLPPGATIQIPSEFDTGIQQTDRNGVVIGGIPQLRRPNEPAPRYAPGIIVETEHNDAVARAQRPNRYAEAI